MAKGLSNRNTTLDGIFTAIYVRLRRLEHPNSFHLGGAGAGYTISIEKGTGNLIATSDGGTVAVICTP